MQGLLHFEYMSQNTLGEKLVNLSENYIISAVRKQWLITAIQLIKSNC